MNALQQILEHDAASPWTFLNGSFWLFLLVVLAFDAALHRDRQRGLRHFWLLAASLLFYWKTSGWFFLILVFSTVSDYWIGHRIAAAKGDRGKNRWLALSIGLNLALLFYFKYTYFLTESWNAASGSSIIPRNWLAMGVNAAAGTSWSVDRILLPVGISFYTFQTISYTVDIRRGLVQPLKRLSDFGFYVSFFPQLVAGPIVRAADFVPQILHPKPVTKATIGRAGFWILNGLLKKVLLADWIAVNFNDRVFASPATHSGFEVLMAMYGYSLQVYADFSGYTDMAIGVALLMGYHLPQNFNSPYKADSCGNFWKRWHMSLSGWLKDYLYIPMGGNRRASWFTAICGAFLLSFVALMWPNPKILGGLAGVVLTAALAMARIPAFHSWVTTNINIWMTMLLGGLWHGAGWNFVIWGGLNGLGITVYKLWRKVSPWEAKDTFLEAGHCRDADLSLYHLYAHLVPQCFPHHVGLIWHRTRHGQRVGHCPNHSVQIGGINAPKCGNRRHAALQHGLWRHGPWLLDSPVAFAAQSSVSAGFCARPAGTTSRMRHCGGISGFGHPLSRRNAVHLLPVLKFSGCPRTALWPSLA